MAGIIAAFLYSKPLDKKGIKSVDKYSRLAEEVRTMLDKYEQSARVRLLVWLVLGAVYLFAFAAFVNAVKWW